LPDHALRFAVNTVVRVGAGENPPPRYESEESFFEQGVERSAARVLPLLLLPEAAPLRALIEPGGGSKAYDRVALAGSVLASNIASEVRLHLARGLDAVWAAPCADSGICHHQTGLQIAIETMRYCAFGDRDLVNGQRAVVSLDGDTCAGPRGYGVGLRIRTGSRSPDSVTCGTSPRATRL
jgi:hypothetical protein